MKQTINLVTKNDLGKAVKGVKKDLKQKIQVVRTDLTKKINEVRMDLTKKILQEGDLLRAQMKINDQLLIEELDIKNRNYRDDILNKMDDFVKEIIASREENDFQVFFRMGLV